MFDIQAVPPEAGPVRTGRGDGDIGLAAPHPLRDFGRRSLEQIESDRGRRLSEAPELFGHIPIGQRMQESEPNPSRVGVAERGDALGGRLHLGDAARGVLQHDLAVSVQPEPPVDPIEQRCSGLAFESSKGSRQRRLADPQLSGGLGDVFCLGEHDEPLQFLEVHHSTITKTHEAERALAIDA